MNIRTERRQEYPPSVENIGLGWWHVRWNIVQKTDEDGVDFFEYNEVSIDHEPSQTEVNEITGAI